jgi:type II secretory ATPase GspE/PulE/Tfp pilus assembly ATPase PilB-like protein
MKVEPFLLASTLNAVIAQRLVRKICDKCKIENKLPPELIKEIKEKITKIPPQAVYNEIDVNKVVFYKGAGCVNCGKTGYKGRLSIVEAINITREIQTAIMGGFHREAVEKELAHQHFITMEQDGILKSLLGLTSIEEVMRVSKVEEE